MALEFKENTPRLKPENQFPETALDRSVQVQPDPAVANPGTYGILTLSIASSADSIQEWGINVANRDIQLRKFWPTEPYIAGAVTNVSFRNAAFDWKIKHTSDALAQAVTEMLQSAIGRGGKIGWEDFVIAFSEDLYTQDNGAFIELIRDPGTSRKFKNENAPVVGIAHLDAGQCIRTGNAEMPVLYTDRSGNRHKMKWYEVITFSDFPSSIEKMNGVGYCAVSRALRLAQIMRSVMLYKDEKVGGRLASAIHVVGGVSRVELEDATKRNEEDANNRGRARYIGPVILASLDPTKPVSVATLEMASLPDGFNYDEEMRWFIAGLALDFGVDYQEFAPLPGGGIGSASQSQVLQRKTSGKGPRVFMDRISNAFKAYGVLPRGATQEFNDKNTQEEAEKQEARTSALEETAIAVNSRILTPRAAMQDLVDRGIYSEKIMNMIPEEFWKMGEERPPEGTGTQPVGNRGGNTIREGSARQNNSKPNPSNRGGRLRKMLPETWFK